MDGALLAHNFAKIGCFLLKLQNCIVTAGFTYAMAIEMSKHSGNIDTSVQMKTIEISEQQDTIEMSRHHGSLEAILAILVTEIFNN